MAAVALSLFLVWSNSFVAIGYLLGAEKPRAQFDWVDLTVARFVTAGLVCGLYCLIFRRREATEVIRHHLRDGATTVVADEGHVAHVEVIEQVGHGPGQTGR